MTGMSPDYIPRAHERPPFRAHAMVTSPRHHDAHVINNLSDSGIDSFPAAGCRHTPDPQDAQGSERSYSSSSQGGGDRKRTRRNPRRSSNDAQRKLSDVSSQSSASQHTTPANLPRRVAPDVMTSQAPPTTYTPETFTQIIGDVFQSYPRRSSGTSAPAAGDAIQSGSSTIAPATVEEEANVEHQQALTRLSSRASIGTNSSAACGSLSPQVPASLARDDHDVMSDDSCVCDSDDDVEVQRLMTSQPEECLVNQRDLQKAEQQQLLQGKEGAQRKAVPRLNQYSDDDNE